MLRDWVAAQAAACETLGSPMYADILIRVAADLDGGGPCANLLAPFAEEGADSALALRLMGSVHRLVLERRAGSLATFYPSVGGRWDSDAGWAAFLELLSDQPQLIAAWLRRPPQTNEVGRSAALMGALLSLPTSARLPVRLHEIGASAGLNLLLDHFTFRDHLGKSFASARAEVVLEPAWSGRPGAPWPSLRIVERIGCDLYPIDPRSTDGRLALTAYVWADQRERLERLRGALAVAAWEEVEVRRESAVAFVDRLTLEPGTTTVLWHSVMWQYLSAEDQNSVLGKLEELGQRTTQNAPLAVISLEPTKHVFEVVVRLWLAGTQTRTVLGTAPGHGLPVAWLS